MGGSHDRMSLSNWIRLHVQNVAQITVIKNIFSECVCVCYYYYYYYYYYFIIIIFFLLQERRVAQESVDPPAV